jgi:ribose 5-phosphate isomerase A
VRRVDAAGHPFITDGGNFILDCRFHDVTDMAKLERDLAKTVGVIDSGLFIGMATDVILGIGEDGSVRSMVRTA